MNIQTLQIKDENTILWIDNHYYMYVPVLISQEVSRIKVKITIDSSYKNIYSNNYKLLEFIDNIVLKSSIQKVPIHWDINKEKYFINIMSKVRKYKIYINIHIDTVQPFNNKRKVLTEC